MSLAWGGHRNGQIPVSALAPIGLGQLPGGMQYRKQQYLHHTAALAWQALVRAVYAETGVRLRVTEGYRDYALQLHYWQTLPFPQAAFPGTSSHGWARAVDMYGYTVSALQAVRRIGPTLGWSLATGDRVNEPWHIEYVASLTPPPDFADDGTTVPIPPPRPRRLTMPLKFTTTTDGGGTRLAVAGLAPGTDMNWYEVSGTASMRAINSQIPGEAVEIPFTAWADRAAQFRQAPAAGSVSVDLQPVLAAIAGLPAATQKAIFGGGR